MNRHVIRYFVGLALCVLCAFWLLTSSSVLQSGATNQDSSAAHSAIRLQYQPSRASQTEGDQPLKRAVVVARKRKSQAGTLFNAYLLLTNVAAANNCDLKKAAPTSDSDFALVAIISEKFKEKDGPEGTAIHRILFGQPDQSQRRYLFIASPTNPEKLNSIVGNVPYKGARLGTSAGGVVGKLASHPKSPSRWFPWK